MKKVKVGDIIYVGDLGEAQVTNETEGIDVHYIREYDGTKSWQLNFDESRGDTVIESVKVIPLEELRLNRHGYIIVG